MLRAGEAYRNKDHNHDIFVLAIDEKTKDGVWLAILWLNPKTHNTSSADELFVEKIDYKNWKKLEL